MRVAELAVHVSLGASGLELLFKQEVRGSIRDYIREQTAAARSRSSDMAQAIIPQSRNRGIIATNPVTLSAGAMLGPYEVVSLLGAGGMGEVYRARDTRLHRVVAVKVLRSGIGDNGDLRRRLEREARAISRLAHPHICALYDVGNHDGVDYLVMEYLEGKTLADCLRRGPLPLSQVLRYGAQIAEALQHAHHAGITHRDLKPGNVMLTSAGAKLLDFGLAKFVERPPLASDDSAPETLKHLTAEGTIVGTFQYMSPEQIQGNAVDHRSDIFSFGVLLYEMTTGQRPFSFSCTR